jgi:hypothetical protein
MIHPIHSTEDRMRIPVRGTGPCAFLVALLLALFAGSVSAQETGKIEGRVTDQGGQPIAGAQVLVVGTRYGNITNPQGYYFVNNVPAGLQDIQAQFIGYQTVTVRQQRVLAGQTLTLNFTLSQSAVAVQAIEVVGERTPLVPRDQVASKNIITGEDVAQLPVDNPRALITLQPGVVASGRVANKVSIRGGRSGEEAVFIDGVLVRSFAGGVTNLNLGTNTLSEVDVLTGGFSAQFGDAQSGIINFVTRSGGRTWTGATSIQSDEMIPKKYSLGLNRGELSFGGPLFGNLGFFAAATAQGQRSQNYGKLYRDLPIYVASGIDTTVTLTSASSVAGRNDVREVAIPGYTLYDEGGRLPFSNQDAYTLDSKLDWSYGSGSRIFLTGKSSRNQRRTSFAPDATTFSNFYNPSGYAGALGKSSAIIFGITHNFVRSAESELSLDLKLSVSNDEQTSGTLLHSWEIEHRDPKLGFTMSDFRFQVENDCHGTTGCTSFPVNQALVDAFLHNTTAGLTPFPGRSDIRTSQEFRLNPYGVATGFSLQGSNGTYAYTREQDKQARATIDWQANRYNRIRFGGDYTTIDVRNASIGYTDASFSRVYVETPKRASAFAQDRIDLGDVVIEAGVRWDRFDPNTNYPNIAGYYNPDDPATFSKVNPENAVSPRLGVSFPVTVNSTFRLSYGHFAQVPDLNIYYRGKNLDFFRFKNTNTNDIFGRPLALGKTIAFEFGYRQLLAPDFVLDIAAYNKDKKADPAIRKLPAPDPTNPGAVAYLNTFTNADFGNIRGVDTRLDRRFGNWFQAMLGYSFQDARDTGTDPFTYTALFARIEGNANQLLGQPAAPPNSIRPTEENRKHNITGTFSLTVPNSWQGASALHNFGLFGTLRFASGLPYTQVEAVGQTFVVGPPFAIGNVGRLKNGDVNTATTPWIKQFDLKVSKGFSMGRFNAQAFADARNLLDLQNASQVFLTTGGLQDEEVMTSFIRSYQTSVGGGTIRDVDLSSLAAAGGGVTNVVNLIALRRTEARFGNNDLKFTQDEQAVAFRQAVFFQQNLSALVDPGRRVRLGIELTF